MPAPRSAGNGQPSEGLVNVGGGAPSGGPDASASFGSQLRWLRRRAGMTREVLAERAGLSVATLAALEGGQRRRPYPNTVVALADALGLVHADRTALQQLASGSAVPEGTGPEPTPKTSQMTGPAARARLPAPPTP